MGGAIDFGALAGATHFAKMLARVGCGHTEGMEKESLAGPLELGGTSDGLRRSVWNFMTSFWIPFGRVSARKMAEERHVEVRSLNCGYSF